ncbi:hypothetical protein SRHO_G00178780 [Serrasalmus rhombeus]
MALLLILLFMIMESAQWCRVAAGVGEERSEAVSYSNSDCLMGSRLCNQLFHASYVSGAFGTKWSVKYNQQEICALKGSTVFMNGTFTHPEGLTVTETFWVIDPIPGVEPTDLSKDPVHSGRVEFFIDKQKHFSLKLSDVMKKDEHQFCFRIITNEEKERWLGKPGVQLRVTELHVEAPEEVTEGETADLTCKTTCSLTDPTFIWYKNGHPLTTKTIKNNQLHLQTVSSEDAGSYSCAVGGSQHLHSTAYSLRVRCHLVTLYAAAGVGLCGVAVFLAVFLLRRTQAPELYLLMITHPVLMTMRIYKAQASVLCLRMTTPPVLMTMRTSHITETITFNTNHNCTNNPLDNYT